MLFALRGSGLIYMQARFYVPWYGRFLSPDPARDQHFEETQSWNIYSYVQNNPVMLIDPDGQRGKVYQYGNNIVIQGRVMFIDPRTGRPLADPKMQRLLEAKIRNDWSGQKGKYNVVVDLDNGPITYFKIKPSGRAGTNQGSGQDAIGGTNVDLYRNAEGVTPSGKPTLVPQSDNDLAATGSHEFGHSTAQIDDQYVDVKTSNGGKRSIPKEGYENDIMGGGHKLVTEKTIDNVIRENKDRGTLIDTTSWLERIKGWFK